MELKISSKLKELREANGLSQDEVAGKLGISSQAISKWEQGEIEPDFRSLAMLADIYKINIESLRDLTAAEQAERHEPNTKLLLITTGGTIGFESTEGVNVKKGVIAKHGFLNNVITNPKNNRIAIEVNNLFNIDSTSMTPGHWNRILDVLKQKHDDYDAFCITHGTNTMAQTASALSFGLECFNKPVFLTGSQVPLGVEGSDANQNFENMIRLARDFYTLMKGVWVVVGATVTTGVRIKKSSDVDYNAFSGHLDKRIIEFRPNGDVLVDEAALAKNNAYYEGNIVSVFHKYPTHIIASLNDHAGIDPEDVRVLVEHAGKKGFVYRGVGVGDVNQSMLEILAYLREKHIPIVATTQIADGVASMDTNIPGIMAKEHSAIPAYDMTIEAITAKMAYLIEKKTPYENFAGEMLRSHKGEINADKYIKSAIK